MSPSTKAILAALAASGAALLPAIVLYGFMVDDALISARVAHHLATGQGYRFNPDGPVVDAVTPLGWAPLLAPFARSGPLAAFTVAKVLGLVSWLGAAAVLGAWLARLGWRACAVGALALLVNAPLAAWSVSGMETGLVTAVATLGLGGGRLAPLCLGMAAGWRPELLPWAAVLAVTRAALEPDAAGSARVRRALVALGAAVAPFILVASVRMSWFGQAFPLSLVAKPPDAVLGVRYAIGGLVFSGPAWLLVAGRLYARASPRTRASALAFAAHVGAVVYAGGDWMPFYRLFVPVLPSVVLAGAELVVLGRSRLTVGLRVGAMLGASALVAVGLGPSARHVGEHRMALIEAARPALAGATKIAALDVGWVGVASPASIVDLAGVTDPSIAALPGSHTAKRLPEGLLELRAVDALVLFVERGDLAEWPALELVHPVEVRVTRLLSFSDFRPVARIPLGGTTRSYVIARRDLGAR